MRRNIKNFRVYNKVPIQGDVWWTRSTRIKDLTYFYYYYSGVIYSHEYCYDFICMRSMTNLNLNHLGLPGPTSFNFGL